MSSRPRPQSVGGVFGLLTRVLLYLYPGEFRRRHREGMLRLFVEMQREARRRGRLSLAAFRLTTLADLIYNGAASRLEAWLGAPSPRPSPTRQTPGSPRPQGAATMSTFFQDLRYGARKLVHRPLHSAVIIFTLALGIGVNTAIFSLVHEIFLKPAPYRDPSTVVMLWPENWFSASEFDYYRQGLSEVAQTAAIYGDSVTLTGMENPARLSGARVSDNFFQVVGVEAALGRVLRPGDSRTQPVVISHALWTSLMGGDAAVLGRELRLDGKIHLVAGVMPAGFHSLPMQADVWLPMTTDTSSSSYEGLYHLKLLARLGPQATLGAVSRELRSLALRRAQARPDLHGEEYGRQADARPIASVVAYDQRTPVLLVQMAMLLVLLIVCANLANLQLAAGSVRGGELALRTALGAGRRRLLRQLLSESLMLALLGGGAGVALAALIMETVRLPEETPPWIDPALNPSVLAAAAAISLLCGVLFGLLPAWRHSRTDLGHLRAGGRAHSAAGGRLRTVLVAAEVALALLLTAGAGLVLESFYKVSRVDPGFRPERLLTLRLTPTGSTTAQDANLLDYYERVRQSVQSLPGVQSLGMAQHVALRDSPWFTLMHPQDHQSPNGRGFPVNIMTADAGYFPTLGIPLLQGRLFAPQDTPQSAPVVIVNEALVRKYWPSESPLGKRIGIHRGGERVELEVVGVVGDVPYLGLGSSVWPRLYAPFDQSPRNAMCLFARTAGPPEQWTASIRQSVWAVEPDVPITRVSSLEDVVQDSLLMQRLLAQLLGAFGLLALALGASGIYGVVSYSVTRRTREIGLRVALGASRGRVLGQILARALRPVLAGLALGLAGAWILSGILTIQLYGASPQDPLLLAGAACVLLLTALLATLLPARRALGIDPAGALRQE
ncbi:MAG TPA: ADOP family duplicated permease [Acidobacteriota bacterium]|nr:ADOP family duplicated permease [Acidobacteriota bacterium]